MNTAKHSVYIFLYENSKNKTPLDWVQCVEHTGWCADGKLCEGVVTSWPVTSRMLSSFACCTCLKMWSRTSSSDQQLWSSFIWSPTFRKRRQTDARKADKEQRWTQWKTKDISYCFINSLSHWARFWPERRKIFTPLSPIGLKIKGLWGEKLGF